MQRKIVETYFHFFLKQIFHTNTSSTIMKINAIKTLLSVFLFVALTSCSNQEPKQFTVAEYEAATKHMDRELYSLVYNQVSRGKFVGKNHVLYSTSNKSGTKFILVNASTKTKNDAFDHTKLAKALSKAISAEVEANDLPINAVSLSEDLKTLQFKSGGDNYSYSLERNTFRPMVNWQPTLIITTFGYEI